MDSAIERLSCLESSPPWGQQAPGQLSLHPGVLRQHRQPSNGVSPRDCARFEGSVHRKQFSQPTLPGDSHSVPAEPTSTGTASTEYPGPWLRTWVEFQVDARINKALRELAEGELGLLSVNAHGVCEAEEAAAQEDAKAYTELADQVKKIEDKQSGMLCILERLCDEVSISSTKAAAQQDAMVGKFAEKAEVDAVLNSLQELEVARDHHGHELEAHTAALEDLQQLIQEVLKREDDLATKIQQCDTDDSSLSKAIERVELRVTTWNRELAARIDEEATATSEEVASIEKARVAAETRFQHLEHEVCRRLGQLEQESLDARSRLEAVCGDIQGQLTPLVEVQGRVDRLEQHISSHAETRGRLEGRLDRVERDALPLADSKTRLDRLEREHSLAAEARSRLEGRFEHLEQDQLSTSEVRSRLASMERELASWGEAKARMEGRFGSLEREVASPRSRLEARFDRIEREIAVCPELLARLERLEHESGEVQRNVESCHRQIEREVVPSVQAWGRLEILEREAFAAAEARVDLEACVKHLESEMTPAPEVYNRLQTVEKQLATHAEARADLQEKTRQLEREIISSADAWRELDGRINKFEKHLGANDQVWTQLHSVEQELAGNTEALGELEARYMCSEKELAACTQALGRLEHVEREVSPTLESKTRLERLEKDLNTLTQTAGRQDLIDQELALLAEAREKLETRMSNELKGFSKGQTLLEAHLKEMGSELSTLGVKAKELERQLQGKQAESHGHDIEGRLKLALEEMGKHMEDIALQQQKGAAELRLEMRQAIRGETAAIRALDEQLWLTDQRLGQRIDELAQMHAGITEPQPGGEPKMFSKRELAPHQRQTEPIAFATRELAPQQGQTFEEVSVRSRGILSMAGEAADHFAKSAGVSRRKVGEQQQDDDTEMDTDPSEQNYSKEQNEAAGGSAISMLSAGVTALSKDLDKRRSQRTTQHSEAASANLSERFGKQFPRKASLGSTSSNSIFNDGRGGAYEIAPEGASGIKGGFTGMSSRGLNSDRERDESAEEDISENIAAGKRVEANLKTGSFESASAASPLSCRSNENLGTREVPSSGSRRNSGVGAMAAAAVEAFASNIDHVKQDFTSKRPEEGDEDSDTLHTIHRKLRSAERDLLSKK